MKVEEFMKLPDSEKAKYENRVDKETSFDIRVFNENEGYGLECEVCATTKGKMLGTSDIREPKFCEKDYAEVNRDSEFVKVR